MSADVFSYRRFDNCGHGNCRMAPKRGVYNPTARCDVHLEEYAALCGAPPGADPIRTLDLGVGPWLTRPQ